MADSECVDMFWRPSVHNDLQLGQYVTKGLDCHPQAKVQ